MSQVNEFVGSYVHVEREVVLASLLSKQHCCIVGPPGWGKTEIGRQLLSRMVPSWSFTRLDPSTPVERVEGMIDPAAAMESPPRFVLDQTGTPYEYGIKAAMLDEMFRPSDIIFDKLLDTLDQMDVWVEYEDGERERLPKEQVKGSESSFKEVCEPPVVIGTANFVAKGDRVEALRDRVALWPWLRIDGINIGQVIEAQMRSQGSPEVPGDVPNWDEIEKVREYDSGQYEDSIKAVRRYLEGLEGEAIESGRRAHPRRAAQWQEIVFRVSAYEHGSPDFTQVSPMAKRVMQHAWPCMTEDEAAEWQAIVKSASDKIGAAIDMLLAAAVESFKEVARMPASERTAAVGDMAQLMQNTETSLHSLPDDDRKDSALRQVREWFGNAAAGEVDKIYVTNGGQ